MAKWYTEADSVMSDHRKCTIAYGLETAKPETKYIGLRQNAPEEGLEKC
ncbi:hypothetical protein EYZ11_007834 [Aspergillus tanneri]|uniref:Uncharacterized protein n=1 Tax=Aspergillus tanneri TaxID=1220188 RepID=A0A4S3JCD6_9EURO|nr:hypothetical protein EYZ11_007834 [Aspergillus tanneri]